MAVVACINCDWPAIRAVTCDVVESEGWTAGQTDGGRIFNVVVYLVSACVLRVSLLSMISPLSEQVQLMFATSNECSSLKSVI